MRAHLWWSVAVLVAVLSWGIIMKPSLFSRLAPQDDTKNAQSDQDKMVSPKATEEENEQPRPQVMEELFAAPVVAPLNPRACADLASQDRSGSHPSTKETLRACVGTTAHGYNLWFAQNYGQKNRRLVVFPDPVIDHAVDGHWSNVVASGVVAINAGHYASNAAARTALQNAFKQAFPQAVHNMEAAGKTTIHEAICCHAGATYHCVVQAVASIINSCVSHYGGSWQCAKGAMPNCNTANPAVHDVIASYGNTRCGVDDPGVHGFQFKNGMGCPVVDALEIDNDADQEHPDN